jgi:O-antigen ligase
MNRWNAFLLLLFLIPLPSGALSNWAWSLASAVIFLLLALEFKSLSDTKVRRQLPQLPLPDAYRRSLLPICILWGIQAWALVQWLVFSLNPFDSLLSLPKGLMYAGVFTLTLLMVDTTERLKQVIWVVILAASFQACYGSLMTLTGLEYGFFQEKERYRNVATGTYINRNHLAGLLELSVALGVGMLLGQPTRYYGSLRQRLRQLISVMLSSKIILRLLLAVMVIALVLTRSRMGNTAFFASLMIAGALALLLMRNKTTSTTVLLTSLLVIDIAIVGTFFGVDKVAERIQETSVEGESRDEVARDTFAMFMEYPITGVGAGNFTYVFPAFKGEDILTRQIYNNAHNDYAQFAAEFGAPATLALGVLVLWAFWNGVTAMRQRNSPLHQGVGFAVVMSIVAYAIHSTVDFNLQIPANAFILTMILALAGVARFGPYSPAKQHKGS